MKRKRLQLVKGQALAQVALMMGGLMVFVALGVDMGYLYEERRRMQNAADAGALAGAREICFGDPDQAAITAEDYAVTRNGADEAQVQIDEANVDVTALKDVRLFFGGIVGVPNVNVGADAGAACGQASGACDLWPIAYSLTNWNDERENSFGKPFIVWYGNNENKAPDCERVQCDCFPDNNDNGICDEDDGDGIPDVLGGESRTWLDFSGNMDPEYPFECNQSGCGTSELSCWLRHGSGYVELPACVTGDTGHRAATEDDVNSRIGDIVALPLFEDEPCENPPGSCPGTHYWVTELGCIEVVGYEKNYELPPLGQVHRGWKGDVIIVLARGDGCATECGGGGGGGDDPGHFRAVSLTH